MSIFPPQLQVVSDLHLESPRSKPLYETFQLRIEGSHIFMVGNIGHVLDEALFDFLRRLLANMRGSRFFYVLGNQEAYRTTLPHAMAKLRAFEEEAAYKYGGRFIFLNRGRFDVDERTTILGCTLWSDVLPHQAEDINKRLTDFKHSHGICDWTLEARARAHKNDRDWLNSQVQEIEETEPQRKIIIATHYSPTLNPKAVKPEHQNSGVSSAFATDMSKDRCWTSAAVRLWVFGHAHYNCGFRDEATGMLLVANQRGYEREQVPMILISPDANGFHMVVPRKEKARKTPNDRDKQETKPAQSATAAKPSIAQRAINRIPILRRLWACAQKIRPTGTKDRK